MLTAIRAGATRRAACAFAGITEDTLANWRHRYSDYSDALTRAEAASEVELVAGIRVAGKTDWRANAWLLERRWPDDYARREKVEMDVNIRQHAEKIAKELGLDPDEVIREAERIASAYG